MQSLRTEALRLNNPELKWRPNLYFGSRLVSVADGIEAQLDEPDANTEPPPERPNKRTHAVAHANDEISEDAEMDEIIPTTNMPAQ